jgi:hypothetical protein
MVRKSMGIQPRLWGLRMSKDKVDYIVVVEMSITDFRNVVKSYLNNGWKLVGNLALVINNKDEPVFYQGMTHEIS